MDSERWQQGSRDWREEPRPRLIVRAGVGIRGLTVKKGHMDPAEEEECLRACAMPRTTLSGRARRGSCRLLAPSHGDCGAFYSLLVPTFSLDQCGGVRVTSINV
jgi:hypothetical protein